MSLGKGHSNSHHANEHAPATVVREETFMLMDLFGLPSGESTFKPRYIGRTLEGSSIKDVLFLAIDIGGEITGPILPLAFELGISVLDTRLLPILIYSLYDEDSELEEGEINEAEPNHLSNLATYNFVYDPLQKYPKDKQKFLFGETEEVTIEEINTKMQCLIKERDVVLVVHGGQNDLRFLDRIRVPIHNIYVMDTQKAAQNPLKMTKRPSLEKLLTELEIPWTRHSLHISGNDANYTLRSLLMIAVRASEMDKQLDERQVALLDVIEGIARRRLPNSYLHVHYIPGERRLRRTEDERWPKENNLTKTQVRQEEQVEEDFVGEKNRRKATRPSHEGS
jgi:hypothetical protein